MLDSKVKNAADYLMRCLCSLSDDKVRFEANPFDVELRQSGKGTRYFWYREARDAENEALHILAKHHRWPFGYDPAWFREEIREQLLQLKDARPQPMDCHKKCVQFLTELVARVAMTKKFTVCVAVQGLGHAPFDLSKCHFERLTEDRIDDGAIGDPVLARQQPVIGQCGWMGMIGKMACSITVDAVEGRHAEALAGTLIEEALDFLRYTQIRLNGFEGPVPQIGLEPGDGIDRCVSLAFDASTRVPTSMGGRISTPFDLPFSQRIGDVPEYNAAVQILGKDETARNDFEKRIVRALAWFGQASLTQSSAVRFVCLTTAMEAIVLLPNETMGITNKFVDRVGKLLGGADGSKVAEDAYDLRSACIHGRGVAPTKPTLELWCHRVCKVIADLLLKPKFKGLDSADALVKAL